MQGLGHRVHKLGAGFRAYIGYSKSSCRIDMGLKVLGAYSRACRVDCEVVRTWCLGGLLYGKHFGQNFSV